MTDVIEKMEKISNEEKSERKPNTYLSGANLSDANLRDANLRGAYLPSPMSAIENLRNIQQRMAKQLERPATKNAVPSWDKINEDLKGFQQVRSLLWDAFEGISPEIRESILEAVKVYLDACVEKGQSL